MLTLTANQTTAYTKLSHYKIGALFMEPGEGKTLPAYNLVNSVPGIDYLLSLADIAEKLGLEAEEVVIYRRGVSVASNIGKNIEFSNSWERNPEDKIMHKNKKYDEYEE